MLGSIDLELVADTILEEYRCSYQCHERPLTNYNFRTRVIYNLGRV